MCVCVCQDRFSHSIVRANLTKLVRFADCLLTFFLVMTYAPSSMYPVDSSATQLEGREIPIQVGPMSKAELLSIAQFKQAYDQLGDLAAVAWRIFGGIPVHWNHLAQYLELTGKDG